MEDNENPEIGKEIMAGGIRTNYHDHGKGKPIVFIHGSGPGVTAWANWRLVIPELNNEFRLLAPDMVGFGYTQRPDKIAYGMDSWLDHLFAFLDAMELDEVSLVGNSFGGALALGAALRQPERIRKMVLMGAMGVSFPITTGLDSVWGYEPGLETMGKIIDLFTYNKALVNQDLIGMRYKASIRPGYQESFSAMFPAPRQRWVDLMSFAEESIRSIQIPTLIVHGREDMVIPMENSLRLFQLIPDARLHLFGRCGHWTQIEHTKSFAQLLRGFL